MLSKSSERTETSIFQHLSLKPTETVWLCVTIFFWTGKVVQVRLEWKSRVRNIPLTVIFLFLLVLLLGMKTKCGCYLSGGKAEGLHHSTQLSKKRQSSLHTGSHFHGRRDFKAFPYLRQHLCAWLVQLNSVAGEQFCSNELNYWKSASWWIYTFWGLTQLQLKSREKFSLSADRVVPESSPKPVSQSSSDASLWC